MDEHLSDFALDDLVYSARTTHPHLDKCALCQRRLHERLRSYEATKQGPEFERTWSCVVRTRRRPSKVRWLGFAAGVAVAATAVVAVLAPDEPSSRPPATLRIKGGVRVGVLRGGQPASVVAEGDRISLVVSAAGHRHALLVAVAEDGTVSQLWPVRTSTSGRVGSAPVERLAPEYRITPGSFAVHGIFSDAPIHRVDAAAHVKEAVAAGRARGISPLDVVVPPLSNSSSIANCLVRVGSAS